MAKRAIAIHEGDLAALVDLGDEFLEQGAGRSRRREVVLRQLNARLETRNVPYAVAAIRGLNTARAQLPSAARASAMASLSISDRSHRVVGMAIPCASN